MLTSLRRGLVLVVAVVFVGCQAATPSPSPTGEPAPTTAAPTTAPTGAPTTAPTEAPSAEPTRAPTDAPTDTPTEVPTIPPTSGPTAAPTATPDAGSWIGPLRVSGRAYSDLSLVVAPDGVVHAAATLGRSIWYVTNSSASWTRHELSSPPGREADDAPSIAIDSSGNLAVAFGRLSPSSPFGRLPMNLQLVTGGPQSWSAPVVLEPRLIREPSLHAAADGSLILAAGEGVAVDVIEEGQAFPLHFVSGLPAAPNRQRIARIGSDPVVRLGPDGRARILFGDQFGTLGDMTLRYATAGSAAGDFTVENIPGTSGFDGPFALAIDGSGVAHAVWHDEDEGGLYYGRRDGSGWGTPQLIEAGLASGAVGLGVDASGALHVATASYTRGAWYFTNRSGAFVAQQLHTNVAVSADLAVDAAGRAHILFALGETRNFEPVELWYAASPAL